MTRRSDPSYDLSGWYLVLVYFLTYYEARKAVRGVTEGYKWLGLMDFFISGGEGEIIPAITKYYWLTLSM